MSPMRNVEIKARIAGFAQAEAACQRIGALFQGPFHQTDTYFNVTEGRLKLRECHPGNSYLIFYRRPDQTGPKVSDYRLVDVSTGMKELLTSALGVIAQVRKTRTLYLWENVRIHLDRVDHLGEFIEFEAVQAAGMDDEDGIRQVSLLMREFAITKEALLASSYLDLILEGG